jgi:hypothetical protein
LTQDGQRAGSGIVARPERLARQLELLKGPGVDQLLSRRSELLEASRRPPQQAPAPIRPVDRRRVLAGLLDTLWPWQRLPFSVPTDGVNVTPGLPGTDGALGALFYQGELAFGGMPSDAGTTEPGVEKYWLHNCQCGVRFPPVITNGQQDSRFLLNASLPGEHNLYGGTTFSGSIHVAAGHAAALGLILGAIVGVANGYVQLLWGIVDTGVVGASRPGDYGQLEYRIIPVLVNEALEAVVRQYLATSQG